MAQQRLMPGRRLRAQRQFIIQQIKPSSGDFPRSITMRLLPWHSGS